MSPRPLPRIAVTMGDPCGIGPEIIVKALERLLPRSPASFLIIGAREIIVRAIKKFASPAAGKAMARMPIFESAGEALSAPPARAAMLCASGLSLRSITPGAAGATEGRAMWECLEAGLALVINGSCAALVTAPVTKSAMSAAGFPYPGHTDWLADQTGGRAVMMLAAGNFRVVPVTVHAPLALVPKMLTPEKILATIMTVRSELARRFRIKSPRISVSGLNPHAGEDGLLGSEEKDVISRAVKEARSQGARVTGPLPADTLFTPAARKTYDAAVCMYHDQAMIPIKTIGMGRAVNVTLGLPIIRTSPAHGAAPDIAWKGKADPASMIAAIKLAVKLAKL
ncbi:MAG TPA: 4-hydroxythreonine-4-phosphate dehydrogenase PdxA [bacterium]|nr:4-hydroxythreonine-4-phosphate dehydrogenase PdxA [bacterium]